MLFMKSGAGQAELARLRALQSAAKPVSFLGLTCSPESEGTVKLNPGQGFHWEECVAGERSARLAADAAALLGKPASELEDISAKDGWQPQEARDFLAEEGTQTTARLLASVVHDHEASPETLYQLNHVRLLKPGPGESTRTNDETRLFVATRVPDYSGSVTLRMREKAALELSGEGSASEFDKACQESQLSYPIICSIRVLVRPRRDGATEHTAPSTQTGGIDAAQHAGNTSAVIVEARQQPWNPPTAAALALHPLLQVLSESLSLIHI